MTRKIKEGEKENKEEKAGKKRKRRISGLRIQGKGGHRRQEGRNEGIRKNREIREF